MLHHAFRRAPEEYMLEPGVAVRRHDDQSRLEFSVTVCKSHEMQTRLV